MTEDVETVVDRAGMVAGYFERLWADQEGYVFVGHGRDPYLAGPGKVKHRHFDEQPFAWSRQRDELVTHVVAESENCDVWVTPGLSANPIRSMDRRKPLPCRHLWVDLDGAEPADLARLDQLLVAGSFTVASGRGPGHLHAYIALDELTDPHTVADLNRRLVAYLHGDASPSALNGYLRPPGTFNYKLSVL